MSPADIVQKLWNYCNVLSAFGKDKPACVHTQAGWMSCMPAHRAQASGDYVEKLTYLLEKNGCPL